MTEITTSVRDQTLQATPENWIGVGICVMKSTFGSKRKPRKIEVDEDEEGLTKDLSEMSEPPKSSMYNTFLLKYMADGGYTADRFE